MLVLVVFLTILAGSLLISGCRAEKVITDIVLSEVIHSIFYTPQYVALHKGFFLEEGLNVRLDVAHGADKGAAALLSGSAQVALFGSEAAVYTWAQGASDPIIAFAQLTQRDGSFLVGRTAAPDFKWTDVKGKTIIGGRKGGVPQMVLEYILGSNGMIPGKDVEIIQNIGLAATAAAFKEGIGDYVQVWEPGASLLAADGTAHIVAPLGRDSGILPYTVFHATASYIQKNPEIIKSFTTAVYKAQQWVATASSSEIAAVIAPSFPDLSDTLRISIIETYKGLGIWSENPVMEPSTLDHLQDLMLRAGEITQKVPFDKVVNTEIARKVVESGR
jgi:NitT/TauT family transport system substrate-binding protein